MGTTTEGKGSYETLDVSKLKVYDASASNAKVEDSIITVNGQKFALVKDAESAKALGSDINYIIASNTTPALADAKALVTLINQKTGLNIKEPTSTTIDMISKASSGSGGDGGLVLQIGDTADDYNQLTVSIQDMHASALGLSGVDISDPKGAQDAIKSIKAAINTVSSVRGTLGATQNRLDHTINNLSVMQENIQDAESTIRDTDVADEMMAYTKNNILVQSAQAMLAQANQVPQGVLQLLQ